VKFSSLGIRGRPVKEDIFVFELSWVTGFQLGLVFWSKAEMLESEFGEASKEGESDRGTTETEVRPGEDFLS